MATLYYPGQTTTNSFLQSRIAAPTSVATQMLSNDTIQQQATVAAQSIFNTKYQERNESLAGRLLMYGMASGIDTVDTVAAVLPGVERNDIWGMAAEDLGMSGLNDFQARNKSGVEVGSGILTAFAGGFMAERYIMGKLGSQLLSSTGLSEIGLIKSAANMMPKARGAALLTQQAAAESATTANLMSTPALRGLLQAHAAKNVGKAVVSESTILALGHENETIWSDDMANNLFWYGLGIAIPGVAGIAQGRAELRQMANDVNIINRRISAMDPFGYIQMRDITADPSLPMPGNVETSYSAMVTQSAFEWRAKVETPGATPTLVSRRSAQEAQAEATLDDALVRLANRPDQFSTGRKISFDPKHEDSKMANHIRSAVKSDPAVMMEVETLVTGDIAGIKRSRFNNIKALKNSNDPGDYAQARRLEQEVPYVMIDQRWHLANREAEEFANFDPAKVELKPIGGFQYRIKTQDGHEQILNPAMKIKGEWSKKSIRDRMAYTMAMKKMSDAMRMAPVKERPSFSLTKDSDWTQYEFAAYHMGKGGAVDLSKTSLKSLDDVRFQALKGKIAAIKNDGLWQGYMDNWDRRKYNLPEASQLERIEDGSSKALNDVLKKIDDGNITNYSDAKQYYNDLLNRHEMIAETRAGVREFEGDMFTFGYNEKGEFNKPILAWHRPRTLDPSKRGLRAQQAEEMARNRQIRFWEMARPVGQDPMRDLVAIVNDYLHRTPEGQSLHRISGLADDQVTGTGSGILAEIGAMWQTTFRARDSKTVTAAVRAAQQTTDLSMAVTRLDIESLGDIPARIAASINKGSKALLNEFVSYRPGWDLLSAPEWDDQTKLWRFVLDDKSAWNAKRLGRPVEEGEFLRTPDGSKDLALDELGMEFLGRFNMITESKRLQENKLRAAMGLGEIRHTPHYVPSENTKNKFLGWVIDSQTGEPVPGRAVVATTAEEFARRRKEMESSLNPGEYFHSQHEIEMSQDIYDQAQMGWVESSFAGRMNKSAKGLLVGTKIRQDTLGELLRYIQEKNVHLGASTMRVALEDQIQIAKMRREVERAVAGQTADIDASVKRVGSHTVWDDYLKAVAGPVSAQVRDRRVTTYLKATEDFIQPGVTLAWKSFNNSTVEQVNNYVKDMMFRFGVKLGGTPARDFEELTKQLGPNSPYATLSQYLDQIQQAKRPPTVGEIAQKLNRFDASIRLRYLEIPNAAMNMLGIINNMPSILASSTAPVIGQLVTGSGKQVRIIDAMKIMLQGTKEWTRRTYDKDWEYAAKVGGLEPGVAEVRKTMAGIDNLTGWQRAFMGDKTIKNPSIKDTAQWVKYHGIDGLMAKMNDTTESWSRQWAHGIGLKLADYQGIRGVEERFNFANSIADAAIANYSPLNRGEMYQTSLGSMMGLYQTYSMNYTGRMFRYLEQGDYRALMQQAAVQSMMFGVKSNIGWDQFEWLESKFDGRDEESTISDLIYAKYGPMVGSAIAHGGVADLAQLFGAPTGIALYQRADTNIRTNVLQAPGSFDIFKTAAALGTAKQLGTALIETSQAMLGDDDLTTARHLSEVLATNMPNRMLRGLMTVGLNDGMDIDRYGSVVSVSNGIFESSVRAMGLRTTRQQDEIDFRYANRASLDKQAAQMEQLRQETQALFRSGADEGDLERIFKAYQARGGNPMQFRSWVRQRVEAATTTREARQTLRALNSEKLQLMLARDGWTQ